MPSTFRATCSMHIRIEFSFLVACMHDAGGIADNLVQPCALRTMR